MSLKFFTKAHLVMDQETQEEIERLNQVVEEYFEIGCQFSKVFLGFNAVPIVNDLKR